MDPETAKLILTLQWQDLEQVKMPSKGKGRETDVLLDANLAIQLQQQEFERAGYQIADRPMAESIHRAVLDDGASVVILTSEENQAANDHSLAYQLATPTEKAACDRHLAVQLNLRSLQNTPQPSSLTLNDDNISWYSAVNDRDDTVNDSDSRTDNLDDLCQAESSAWAASRTSESHQGHCVSCQEMKEIVSDVERALVFCAIVQLMKDSAPETISLMKRYDSQEKLAGNCVRNVNIWLN
ncbi:MAG: hypothetical protein L6R37_000125 [Teloschistes peruensis]|nr:MAG: hypothetical protein L6R37_000125 [Teloschistes peruensis]